MMLQTLEGLSELSTRRVLGEALLKQLPAKLVPASQLPADIETAVEALVREVRIRLSIDVGDDSEDTKSRVADLVASELVARAMPSSMTDVASRLGQQGQLAPKDYEIEPLHRSKNDPDLRVTDTHVRTVLRNPDAVQHLQAPVAISTEGGLSLYAKRIEGRKGGAFYIMLVPCERHGRQQRPLAGLRVYPSEIDLNDVSSLLELLERFLEVYGLPFAIGDEPRPRKLVIYERVKPDAGIVETKLVSPLGTSETDWMCMIFKRNQDGSVDLAIVFRLNVSLYRESLSRHRA